MHDKLYTAPTAKPHSSPDPWPQDATRLLGRGMTPGDMRICNTFTWDQPARDPLRHVTLLLRGPRKCAEDYVDRGPPPHEDGAHHHRPEFGRFFEKTDSVSEAEKVGPSTDFDFSFPKGAARKM